MRRNFLPIVGLLSLFVLGACSAERDPKIASLKHALEVADSQLLDAAASYIRPGGYLCYSTCTITEEENSGNLRRFREKHPEFQPASMERLAQWLPQAPDRQAARRGAVQLWPKQDGTEGFFIALLRKRPD